MTDHRKRQQPGYNPMNLRMPGSVKDNSSLSSLADFTLLTSFFARTVTSNVTKKRNSSAMTTTMTAMTFKARSRTDYRLSMFVHSYQTLE